jgi:hypothetical protein
MPPLHRMSSKSLQAREQNLDLLSAPPWPRPVLFSIAPTRPPGTRSSGLLARPNNRALGFPGSWNTINPTLMAAPTSLGIGARDVGALYARLATTAGKSTLLRYAL